MFLYVEQDVNLAQQSCSGLKNVKNSIQKNVKNTGKRCLQSGRNGLKCALKIIVLVSVYAHSEQHYKRQFSSSCFLCEIIHLVAQKMAPQDGMVTELGIWGFRYCSVAFRAGHLRYFFIFSIIKNYFFGLFIKLITYF